VGRAAAARRRDGGLFLFFWLLFTLCYSILNPKCELQATLQREIGKAIAARGTLMKAKSTFSKSI
jgi:hypothetical protein